MSWLGSAISGVVRKVVSNPQEAEKVSEELEKTLQLEIEAKTKILLAEIQGEDIYTKRARPTILYAGVGMVVYKVLLEPIIAHFIGFRPIESPVMDTFLLVWGGLVGTYVVGRSFEKRGVKNKITSTLTGSILNGL